MDDLGTGGGGGFAPKRWQKIVRSVQATSGAHLILGVLSPGVKQPSCEGDYFIVVTNERCYTSTLPKQRKNFTYPRLCLQYYLEVHVSIHGAATLLH